MNLELNNTLCLCVYSSFYFPVRLLRPRPRPRPRADGAHPARRLRLSSWTIRTAAGGSQLHLPLHQDGGPQRPAAPPLLPPQVLHRLSRNVPQSSGIYWIRSNWLEPDWTSGLSVTFHIVQSDDTKKSSFNEGILWLNRPQRSIWAEAASAVSKDWCDFSLKISAIQLLCSVSRDFKTTLG